MIYLPSEASQSFTFNIGVFSEHNIGLFVPVADGKANLGAEIVVENERADRIAEQHELELVPLTVVDARLWLREQTLIAIVVDRWWHTRVAIRYTMRTEHALQVAVVERNGKIARAGLGREDEAGLVGNVHLEFERDATRFGCVPFVEPSRALGRAERDGFGIRVDLSDEGRSELDVVLVGEASVLGVLQIVERERSSVMNVRDLIIL